MWDPSEPFNQLKPPPVEKLETRKVLKATVGARAALAALDQSLKTIPNPGILIGAIALLEAQASSEVENIFTTADDLFRSVSNPQAATSSETKETIRYRLALYRGAQMVKRRPLTASIAKEVCTQLLAVETDVRDLPGTYIGNPATGTVTYTPPDSQARIRRMLSDWEMFMHGSKELDPLVIMAAAHYQFEAIHPFRDGNGRTGRVLNVLLLLQFQLLQEPVLYLSRYIIKNKDEYYSRLLAVTKEEAWEEWLLYMLAAVESTAEQTLETIGQIQKAQNEFRSVVRERTTAGANSDLINTLFEQPYCRIGNVVESCGVSRPTASNWLRGLVAAGLLEELKAGREKLFVNRMLMDILTLK